MSFEPGTKESNGYAEKMADLEEVFPKWVLRVEEEAPKPKTISYLI